MSRFYRDADYSSLGDAWGAESQADASTTTPSGAPTRQGGGDWSSALTAAIPVLASVYQQREMTRLNIARANAGVAPLTTEEYMRFYQPPQAQVQIGATPDAQRMLMYGGLAILGLVGLRAAKII